MGGPSHSRKQMLAKQISFYHLSTHHAIYWQSTSVCDGFRAFSPRSRVLPFRRNLGRFFDTHIHLPYTRQQKRASLTDDSFGRLLSGKGGVLFSNLVFLSFFIFQTDGSPYHLRCLVGKISPFLFRRDYKIGTKISTHNCATLPTVSVSLDTCKKV